MVYKIPIQSVFNVEVVTIVEDFNLSRTNEINVLNIKMFDFYSHNCEIRFENNVV